MPDAVVIGGGAAGSLAACVAAERGKSVLLLEPNRELGRKLRLTGKGRCNLTNLCEPREFLENVRIVNDTAVSEVYEQILRVGPGDVLIGISYPRYSHRTVKALEYAGHRGARVIAVTDGENSPLVPLADISLFARSEMVSFLDSLVAPLSLINALIVAIGMHAQEKLEETFSSLEKLWSEYEVYEKNNV